jgi:hypothetical protein
MNATTSGSQNTSSTRSRAASTPAGAQAGGPRYGAGDYERNPRTPPHASPGRDFQRSLKAPPRGAYEAAERVWPD